MNQSDSRQLRNRRIRLQRLKLAILCWIISFGLAFYCWSLDELHMTLPQFGVIAMTALIIWSGVYFAIRSGWSERFRDPSLTLFQILVATLISLYVIAHAGGARTILLLLFVMAAFFGVLQLRREEFALVALVSVIGYGAILLSAYLDDSGTGTRMLFLEFGVFAVVMFWIAFIGTYVANMRRALSQRNRELDEATRHLQHMAEHDELTGLPNRRRMLAQLEQARLVAGKKDRPFCVAVLDLDHFKRINDRYGHQAGDEVLAGFANRTETVLRDSDQVLRVDESASDIGRFGGEEFLAILPGTDLEGARLAAGRLRECIAENPFDTNAGPIECTVSIGVTQYGPDEEVHHTIGRADEALYRAKDQGRNRVVAAEPS